MKSYLSLLRQIREHGTAKHPTRTESGATTSATIGLPNLHFTHDLADGFPLLTTRKLPWKNIVGELRGFLDGCTTNQEFVDRGCHFWTPWANSLNKRHSGEVGDLGPIYGHQWNAHNQLTHVLNCLRECPTDRRMVVSAWRPDEHCHMALPPCHVMWIVTPYEGRLNLSWFQRSCDFPIGVPCNIASYALLAHLLAKWANMETGTIDCIFCDSHIYENQLDGVDEQLNRTPSVLPNIEVWFNSSEFRSWECRITGWKPQPKINFGEVEI
jgi:thymidylate synthase